MAKQKIFKDFDLSFTPHPLTGDIAMVYDEQSISQSLKNIILTDFFEKPFFSNFGCNVRGLLFENTHALIISEIKKRIKEAINNFEPRIVLQNIDVFESDEGSGFIVFITYVSVLADTPSVIELFLERTL